MNNIIKLILLNLILFYFLIKKNKYISIVLIIILIIYTLFLKYNKNIEGNELIDEKKQEVKLMKMVNLDNVLEKLLNIYEDSNKDCIGEYSEY